MLEHSKVALSYLTFCYPSGVRFQVINDPLGTTHSLCIHSNFQASAKDGFFQKDASGQRITEADSWQLYNSYWTQQKC